MVSTSKKKRKKKKAAAAATTILVFNEPELARSNFVGTGTKHVG